MAKLFAIVMAVITLVSVWIFVAHTWWFPTVASEHGVDMDHQFKETFIAAGFAFLVSQLGLATFVWKYADRGDNRKIRIFPGGARWLIILSLIFVGSEVFALEFVGQKVWSAMYFKKAPQDSLRVQVLGGQFAFYFRYPGPDNKFAPIHVDKIDEGTQNYFGLDKSSDEEAKDDVVTASLAVPINRPVELLLEAKDVGHAFYVRELRIQQDLVPGMEIAVHFLPTRLGKFEVVCTQLCGLGHYNMRAYVEVMTQENFDKWLADQVSQQ